MFLRTKWKVVTAVRNIFLSKGFQVILLYLLTFLLEWVCFCFAYRMSMLLEVMLVILSTNLVIRHFSTTSFDLSCEWQRIKKMTIQVLNFKGTILLFVLEWFVSSNVMSNYILISYFRWIHILHYCILALLDVRRILQWINCYH